MVFLHGWGGDASAFSFVAKKFEGEYNTFVYEFAGFGATPEPDRPYTVNDYANEVLGYLHSKGIESATLVGHSFGGRVAIEIAAQHPSIVDKLVLVDSAGVLPRRTIKYKVKIFANKLLKKFGFYGLRGSSDYAKLSGTMRKTFVNVVNYDETPLLDKITAPTAIFWGKDDNETPRYMAQIINSKIKDSALFLLNGGHYSYVDDFQTFCLILSAFLHGGAN